ncbi:hypothetical protein M422DRAFT_257910 [Sphaerobolus stellatus SS14]|uniref:Uncharacterized protein n=1 Tax=Sphaerobolus stellatus (strain SS14) TaxID=990650 RepID=A0A0C9UWS6_SPHS4|nr:hypothetical protein M422DRAFT_257910 [Sphaerobolus stellatus SS14]
MDNTFPLPSPRPRPRRLDPARVWGHDHRLDLDRRRVRNRLQNRDHALDEDLRRIRNLLHALLLALLHRHSPLYRPHDPPTAFAPPRFHQLHAHLPTAAARSTSAPKAVAPGSSSPQPSFAPILP